MERLKENKGLVFFALLGILQMGYVIYLAVEIFSGKMPLTVRNVCILILFSINMVIIYSLWQKKQCRELERKLAEEQFLMEMEQVNYEWIEERRLQIAKIRHDLNNELATVEALIAQEKEAEALSLLDALKETMAKEMGYSHCEHPLLNVVLNDCKEKSERKGIEVSLDVSIPEDSFMESEKLCLFFYLLLESTDGVDPEVRPAKIELSAKEAEDRLEIALCLKEGRMLPGYTGEDQKRKMLSYLMDVYDGTVTEGEGENLLRGTLYRKHSGKRQVPRKE